FSRLKYISVYNLNLGVEREGVSDKHWIYFPEEKFCFFRVGFPTNFSADVAPKSNSSLYVELSYSEYRPLRDKQNVEKRIHADLLKAGILRKTDKIVARHINDIKYAYVIYDRNYRVSIKIISDFLFENNIIAAGRFGRWNYMSMEDVILEGKAVSEQVKHL
ncbi:MAG: hypothetical protein KKH34_02170, partial [Candidatus Omnitrophica bacterium]|nr:hypothetical protein [Candidatus Omnitrophota bacterium]